MSLISPSSFSTSVPSENQEQRRRRVLVITGDPIGAKMAGPAIRAWNIAQSLADENDVTLMSLLTVEPITAPFSLVAVAPHDNDGFVQWEDWADVIVFQGHAMEFFEALQKSSKILVADIYDPMHLEQLEQAREFSREIWDSRVEIATTVLNQQLSRADFFLCASERQRLFYLGQLAALGRITPATYEGDPDLRRLIAVVPFGLLPDFPTRDRNVLKGTLPGIGSEDKVLIWSGGVYNWFDPKTLIRAVASLASSRPNVRLFFQGTKHPHVGVPEMAVVAESRALAESLGVLDRSVFFNRSWVEYADRHNYLAEADAGVSTHYDHIETTMSFRTRILDYLWAGLPIVATDGDVFADLIRDNRLGIVVPAQDPDALAAALDTVLYDEQFIADTRRNIAEVRESFYWSTVLKPLTTFVRNGRHAGDAVARIEIARRAPVTRAAGAQPAPSSRLQTIRRAVGHLREGGPRRLAEKVVARLRHRAPDEKS